MHAASDPAADAMYGLAIAAHGEGALADSAKTDLNRLRRGEAPTGEPVFV
jgi:hypothetical protein